MINGCFHYISLILFADKMCSVAGGDGFCESMTTSSTPKAQIGDECKKCKKEKAVLVLRLRDAYCKDCFVTASTHKFRSTLGKNKALRPGDKVLVAFNGSSASLALLHLLAKDEPEGKKKVSISVSVLIIDEGFGIDSDERTKVVNDLIKTAQPFEFPIYVSALECDDHIWEASFYKSPSEDQTAEVRLEFPEDVEITALESSLTSLKKKMIMKAAEELQIEKVITAETTTSLAVSLMTGLATGRGAQLADDVAFKEPLTSQIGFYRPMREFSKKETVLYCLLHGLDLPRTFPTFSTGKSKFCSIEKLTEDFVLGLQEDFPATVPTIFKTGGKLETSDKKNVCKICLSVMDVDKVACTAVEAATVSKIVSVNPIEQLEDLMQKNNIRNENICYACKINQT